jgi:uncharacterized repeat protein (TIGR03806 family)
MNALLIRTFAAPVRTGRAWLAGLLLVALPGVAAGAAGYGATTRVPTQPYLRMPPTADGPIPTRLSETGAFKDIRQLVPADELLPYELVVPFWSDHAIKSRWIAVPSGQTVKFSANGEWVFPAGTVLVKHFDLALDETKPGSSRRLETRLIIRAENGGIYGVTYKWRSDNSDADLVQESSTEEITIRTVSGTRVQPWYYPNQEDCRKCHTPNAGFVLGLKTRQLNRDVKYPSGVTDNQLRTWGHLGLFDAPPAEAEIPKLPKLARLDDPANSLEARARSYLDANCAHCHRPGGTVAEFDARFDTPLARQNLVGGQVLINQGIDRARIVAPNDTWRSILFMRANTLEAYKMPPLARNTVDEPGMALLRAWIESMPAPPVQPPPAISPRGGNFERSVTVALRGEPGATLHYTVDGSSPTSSDPVYEKPLVLKETTILRARAFKPGSTQSIPSQEIFVVSE